MPVFVIIWETMLNAPMNFNIKIIHRVIPTTLDKVEQIFKQNMDLIRNNTHYRFQVYILFRGDTSIFEEIVKSNE
jgi:hypothetical protein